MQLFLLRAKSTTILRIRTGFLIVAFGLSSASFTLGQQGKSAAIPEDVTPRDAITLKGHGREVTCMAFHPSGSLLTSGGNEGAYITWDIAAFCKKIKKAQPSLQLSEETIVTTSPRLIMTPPADTLHALG